LLSRTWNVNELVVPVDVGVPEITPVEEFNVKPAGSEVLPTLNVYGESPPLVCNVKLKALPFVPKRVDGVTTDTGLAITTVTSLEVVVLVVEFKVLVTTTLYLNVPAVVCCPKFIVAKLDKLTEELSANH